MRLAHSTLHAYRLPYERPVRWSDIVEEGGTFLMLRLQSDEGHEGVAEMTVKPTWTGFGLEGLRASLAEVLLPRLAQVDLSDAGAVARCLEGIPGLHAPKALVDNAVWDLRAAAAGAPLWQQWQGRARVPVSFTVTRQAPGLMAREAAALVERLGLRMLKVKGGQGVAVDAEALRALRSAVGDGVGFYVDANGAYAPGEARDYAQALFDAGACVVEDPCPLAPGRGFTALQAGLPGPLLVDFGCWSAQDTALFIEAGARAFSLKPGRFGLTVTRAMQALAEAAGATTVVGMFGESAVGTWQALMQAASLDARALPAEVTWFLSMREQVLHEVPAVRDGCIELPAAASVAGRVDWERVGRLSVAPAQSLAC
ncbi:mandelate racemase/muconate lactonizing enzyme family protein [Ramlibacter sp. MAHUQ-53]|uniref:mandelate racemase/muconate lactonizing enzyme family protein n=1 Tax=unclassified Ramlibacter TaxID=2617605 RepID=UPI00363194AB